METWLCRIYPQSQIYWEKWCLNINRKIGGGVSKFLGHVHWVSFLKHPDLKKAKTSTNCTELYAQGLSKHRKHSKQQCFVALFPPSQKSSQCESIHLTLSVASGSNLGLLQNIQPVGPSRMTSLVSNNSCHVRSLQAFLERQKAMALKKGRLDVYPLGN